nr:DUF2075 domain-containing protein [Bifidobacterium sp. SO4]
MYQGHNVHEITRNGAGATNLSVTSNAIDNIITRTRESGQKAICFVTGVPGAGKTLVGLNIAVKHSNSRNGERATYLSGNGPLVDVLMEALAQDKVSQEQGKGIKLKISDARRDTTAFIQKIHNYRDDYVGNDKQPTEHVVIFDEAQRAWTLTQIRHFMSQKKHIPDFQYSEPEFLIQTMDRHTDWAVIICLVGGGQEIHDGEAGLPEWFAALQRTFPRWKVYASDRLRDDEYLRGKAWDEVIGNLDCTIVSDLHLSTDLRSFRAPSLAVFMKAILDVDPQSAISEFNRIKNRYPIVLTRDLNSAKRWVKDQSIGNERFGILASSGGLRLKPEGIFVKSDKSVVNWFLKPKTDIRSSYAMEDCATEFDVQGLEVDYAIVAWDADFRFDGTQWNYLQFKGSTWNNINSETDRRYLKNAYRVLLTRARQGMVIFIPKGNKNDITRNPEFYDLTYKYLRSIGIPEI